MTGPIAKAAVIGAGTMGAGIAAHFANAGLDVVLLDVSAALAAAGLERQKHTGLMHPSLAARFVTGSVSDDLALLSDADWIVEAVAERIDIKRQLYAAIETVRKSGAIVSSNTSSIALAQLTETVSPDFAEHFLVTHFFNPPRHMQLLELVSGPNTRPEVTAAIAQFGDIRLGKGVIACKDRPGFIANRIGCFWLAAAQNEALALGVPFEEADAVLSKPFGIPKTGAFGLLDLIGIDLIPQILESLQEALPADDPIQAYAARPAFVGRMIEAGQTGRKGGSGFYRMSPDRQTLEVLDLVRGDYRAATRVEPDSLVARKGEPMALMLHPDRAGHYAARVMLKTLAYAAQLVPEIADNPASVDAAMRLGYAWKEGPFELIDRCGPGAIAEALRAVGEPVPPLLARAVEGGGFYRLEADELASLQPDGRRAPLEQPDGVLTMTNLARRSGPVRTSGEHAALWDLGDGIAGIELRTRMNTLSPGTLNALDELLALATANFAGLVIGSDAANFSVGADLKHVLALAEASDMVGARDLIARGQAVMSRIKYAPIPVVGAVSGFALGGGCELLLHCAAIQAHAESQIGLVEPRVGLVPGWGGCKEMLLRAARSPGVMRGPVAPVIAIFDLIGSATQSRSAHDARELGFLSANDGITMNRARLLADAKARALSLAENYAPPLAPTLALLGPSGAATLRNILEGPRGSPHDRVIGEALIGVLTGGIHGDPLREMSEAEVMDLEHEAFVSLLSSRASQDRIRHMIETGKPLRN